MNSHQAVLRVAVTAHQIQREAVRHGTKTALPSTRPPRRCIREHPPHQPSAGSPSGRAPSRSRALVAPSRQSSARFPRRHALVGGNVLVAPDADRAARALDAVARAPPTVAHRPPFERELVPSPTRCSFVARVRGASRPCRAARPCRRLLASAPITADPAVHPPRRATARSRAGQASGSPIGSPEAKATPADRGTSPRPCPSATTSAGLLAAQREVAERVALAVLVEQGAQLRLSSSAASGSTAPGARRRRGVDDGR